MTRSKQQRDGFLRCVRILNKRDQRRMFVVACLQTFLNILDLFGVIAIGMLVALSVQSLQSTQSNGRMMSTLEFLGISNQPLQSQVAILGIGAVLILVSRTVLSIFFTRRTLFFLSGRGAEISANLISALLARPLEKVQSRTSQETLYAATRGVELVALQVLATSIVLIADFSLLIILGIGLFILDPVTSMGILLLVLFIGFALYKIMHVRAQEVGTKNSELNIKSNEKVVEVFSSYRESVVRNRRAYYAREITKLRIDLAETSAEMNFMPYVSKYVIETTVIFGALLVGAAEFLMLDASEAASSFAIFLAAGTRIAPAVLRVQQAMIAISIALGQATPTLELIAELGTEPNIENVDDSVNTVHEGFVAQIQVDKVSFTYESKANKAISEISLHIPTGASVAFVGPSGAGKTTIIDVLLGVLNPDEGSVLISGLPPLLAVAKWPGAVSYVPQDVVIAAGTIRENVALGYPAEVATDELVMSALKVAHLDRFVAELPDGVDTQVGERGAKISGGQRQRLGIARAMFTKPHLLVLDEATSSLDGETEASISEAIHALRGSTTVVMIAHRLSTVRNADIVVYLSEGKVLAQGTFEEVRKSVPDFDRQAKLMGL